MLSVDEARDRILSRITPLEPIDVELLDALDMVLAADLVSGVDLPPFHNSAMDGYALRSIETKPASPSNPVRFLVRGESAAGHPADQSVTPSTAVRIMTGAPIPEGADAVVRFEDVRVLNRGSGSDQVPRSNLMIELTSPCRDGQNVRNAGEDVQAGDIVLDRGAVIGPAQIGLLAALNVQRVSVIRRPVVAILATGDELVGLGADLKPGQIRDSNSLLIVGMVRRAGGEARSLGIAHDSEHDIRSNIHSAAEADLIVTCGGVSVGDFDVVKNVLQQEGQIDLWQVGIKPGKPMAFGSVGGTPLLGLPGNPVAAAVTFSQFGRPIIRRMLGMRVLAARRLTARLEHDVLNRGGRRNFVRGIVRQAEDEFTVAPVSRQGSGSLSGLALANCYIVCDENLDFFPAGSMIEIELIDMEQSI